MKISSKNPDRIALLIASSLVNVFLSLIGFELKMLLKLMNFHFFFALMP